MYVAATHPQVHGNTNNQALDIQEDLEMMRTRLADEARISNKYGTGSWALFRGAVSELSRKGMRNRLLLVFCAFALQNMSGAAAINYYSPTLFASIGISDVSLYTGIYGLVKGKFLKSKLRWTHAYINSHCLNHFLRLAHRSMGKTLSNHHFFRNVFNLSMDSRRIRQNRTSSIRDFSWW